MAKSKIANIAGSDPGLKLTDEQRAFLVTEFATFKSPQQVANAANARFGLNLTRQQASHYSPDSAHGGKYLASKWKALHAQARAQFLDTITAIPIAHRSMRLMQLQTHYDSAVERGNIAQALSILKQAAEEAGGVLTNERKVTHSGRIAVEDVSDEEKIAFLAERLRDAWEKERAGKTSGTRH